MNDPVELTERGKCYVAGGNDGDRAHPGTHSYPGGYTAGCPLCKARVMAEAEAAGITETARALQVVDTARG